MPVAQSSAGSQQQCMCHEVAPVAQNNVSAEKQCQSPRSEVVISSQNTVCDATQRSSAWRVKIMEEIEIRVSFERPI